MRLQAFLIAAVFTLSAGSPGFSQSKSSAPSPAISPDLLDAYRKTQSVTTEAEVTAIARVCSKVVPDTKRSKADREYASSLLAWSLNRRGEMRSAAAAEKVELGNLSEADALDAKALEDYKTAVEYAPTNWRVHHNLAISLAMKGQYKNAIDRLNTVIDLKDDYANAYFNLGELNFELKQYPQAIGDYSRAIELANNDPQYYNSRGHCQFMLENYDEAIADYRRAVDLAADSAVYHTDLADALQFTGNWKEAAELYRQAVAINGQYARAYQNAAWMMATCPDKKFRNTELAISSAKKALELEPAPSMRAFDTLAAAYAATGKMQEAVKYQKRAVQLASESERDEIKQRLALYERGVAYVQPEASDAQPTQIAAEPKPKVRTASETTSTRKSR
ncbi:MAG: tetratricopeptide repeat protein [Pirellulaceae bacterium]|nr:tetratricopeptide repeat protein [Pirellulaceae bacterium]